MPSDASESMPSEGTPPGGPALETRSPAAASGLAKRLARGSFWSLVSLAITQGAAIGAQVVLGYKLSTEFALYMVAIAVYSTISIIRDAGLRKILIVRGAEYDTLARPVFLIALSLNLVSAAAMVCIAPFMAAHSFATPQPKLIPMMWVMAAADVVASFGVVQSAKLAKDLRFKALAAQAATSGVLRQAAAAVLALAGAGVMSFVWPMLLAAAFDGVAMRWLAGPVPKSGRLTWPLFKDVFQQSKWIMVALLGSVLIYRADGLLVAHYEDLDTVVKYYGWAIALTVQALQPFTNLIYSAVLPGFVQIVGDPQRAKGAYLRMAGVVTAVSAPAVLLMCLACPLAIHLAWRGRWDPAIPAVVLILAATPFKSLQACALAFDESHKRFRRTAILLVCDGVTVLVAVAIGVHAGGLVSIALAIAIQRMGFSACHAFFVGHRAELSESTMIGKVLPPVVLAGTLAAACLLVSFAVAPWGTTRGFAALAAATIPTILIYLGIGFWFAPERWQDVRGVIHSRSARAH